MKGKQTKAPHKKTNVVGTSRCLELLHIDLMGPSRTESLGGKRYIIFVDDDFSRYSWVGYLREKSDAFTCFKTICLKILNEKGSSIARVRSDRGKEFENSEFDGFCDKMV